MIYVMAFIGLLFGSFASVIVSEFCEMIDGKNFDIKRFLLGRSKCPKCEKELKWFNLIPLLSFILQRGKCVDCSQKISWLYPLLEICMSSLFVGLYLLYGIGVEFLLSVAIVFVSLIILFVDLKTLRIPTVMSWALIVLGFVYGYIVNGIDLVMLVCGGVLGFMFFYLQSVVSKGKWVGMGDADLGLAIGFMFGPIVGLYTILQSYVFGTLVLVPMMLLNKDKYGMKSQVPFGPFLVFGLIFSMFLGNMIVEWYIQNFIIL